MRCVGRNRAAMRGAGPALPYSLTPPAAAIPQEPGLLAARAAHRHHHVGDHTRACRRHRAPDRRPPTGTRAQLFHKSEALLKTVATVGNPKGAKSVPLQARELAMC